ncbi:1,4-alpha-glucan branching enzyme GlgB [Cerasicoccus arenae]|uniref:1,4-alpha-glucan branching enzyme GlgB n=1 Tax=Cerasicoccus arenae TaxID=424488 RepID=A0A8J3D8H5_9BACT|nr:1,4-alpha-glucan branching protein GlgB [Cerasicoccus arenae]GHB89799.1 1,4-alpha-glucan branching enzyme GlgB [Cerasicoccus arenae]
MGLHCVEVIGGEVLVARSFQPNATTCDIVDVKTDERFRLKKLCREGMFEGVIPGRTEIFNYRIRTENANGEVFQFWDPYCFLPSLTEDDTYLFNQGNHHHVYEKLGAHVKHYEGVMGTAFAVWAPSAKRVSVVGEFNGWDGRRCPMRRLGSSGVWELFLPGIGVGTKYKYELIGADNSLRLKSDPYASYFESPPHNASIVWDTSDYKWSDGDWIKQRAKANWETRPMSVYELHLGSWKRVPEDGNRPLNYREMASELTRYVLEMGFTHVEFMPLAEHPFDGSWGYQVTGFFAPTHRYGAPQDFMYLVDYLHQHNIGVIIDWVPAHFPKDAFALAEFDGTCLYEHEDPRLGEHMDWGTLIFNYSRHEVRNFLISSALAWCDKFHIDGLRVDAVASMLYLDYSREEGEWIPNEYGGRENIGAIDFLRQVNDLVHQYHPGAIMLAEESTSFGGVTKPTKEWGLGFDLKWNMGWMHDTLQYLSHEPVHRKFHHSELTFGMLYQNSERFITVFSHDEVVHGKGSMITKMGAGYEMSKKAADLRCLYTWMWLWPGKKCLFMGCEFGQSSEWRYDGSLQWDLLQYMDHQGVQLLVRDLNGIYHHYESLARHDHDPKGFEWINADGYWENSISSFLRLGEKPTDTFAVVANFTPVHREEFRVGVPFSGHWKEVINSNANVYGGEGSGNGGGAKTDPGEWDGREQSIPITLPGHSVMVFKYEGK